MQRGLLRCCLAAAALLTSGAALAQATTGVCGNFDSSRRVYDYRSASSDFKRTVEGRHFTPDVEALRRGTTGTVGGDLDYTLGIFPNHPRALNAMARLAERHGGQTPPGARYPAECYYVRAVRFHPDDAAVRALYANYLIGKKRVDEARIQLERAQSGAENDPTIAYNIGLAYFNLKDYENSAKFAKQAYSRGITAPALRDKLQKIGKWRP